MASLILKCPTTLFSHFIGYCLTLQNWCLLNLNITQESYKAYRHAISFLLAKINTFRIGITAKYFNKSFCASQRLLVVFLWCKIWFCFLIKMIFIRIGWCILSKYSWRVHIYMSTNLYNTEANCNILVPVYFAVLHCNFFSV